MEVALFIIEKTWVLFSSFFRETHTANKCGHKTKCKGMVTVGNTTYIMTMPVAENCRPNYCLKCVGNMSINCSRCGESIVIGNSITLYKPSGTDEVPDYAVRHTEKGEMFVGCCRFGCIKTGEKPFGFWRPGDRGTGSVYPLLTQPKSRDRSTYVPEVAIEK